MLSKQVFRMDLLKEKNKSLSNWQATYAEMPVNVEPFEKVISASYKKR